MTLNNNHPTLHIGSSGWRYSHWKGKFYPEDLASTDWFPYYARVFNSVEVDTTFYRQLDDLTIKQLQSKVTTDFLFSIKANRLLTHVRRLHQCDDLMQQFLDSLVGFNDNLGPILFQLPNVWPINIPRLELFLLELPSNLRFAIEFRHPSWYSNEILEILYHHNVAICINDIKDLPHCEQLTADFVYLRLHGPTPGHSGSYSFNSLCHWSEKVQSWQSMGKDVYVYFDNDASAYCLSNARLLSGLCRNKYSSDQEMLKKSA